LIEFVEFVEFVGLIELNDAGKPGSRDAGRPESLKRIS